MIEKTAMNVTKWYYTAHAFPVENDKLIENITTLQIMRKRAPKKRNCLQAKLPFYNKGYYHTGICRRRVVCNGPG